MTDDTATTAIPHAGIAMVLPEDWFVVELTDDDQRVAEVTALVAQQLGDSDELAPLRDHLTRDLLAQTARAAQAHGLLLAISLMQVDGVPVPASVTVHHLPGARLDDHGRAVIAEVARADAAPGLSVDLGETPHGVVLRRVRATPLAHDVSDLTEQRTTVETFVVDYWVEPTGTQDLVQLTFSSPLVGARDALVTRFDTVTRSVHAGPGDAEG